MRVPQRHEERQEEGRHPDAPAPLPRLWQAVQPADWHQDRIVLGSPVRIDEAYASFKRSELARKPVGGKLMGLSRSQICAYCPA